LRVETANRSHFRAISRSHRSLGVPPTRRGPISASCRRRSIPATPSGLPPAASWSFC